MPHTLGTMISPDSVSISARVGEAIAAAFSDIAAAIDEPQGKQLILLLSQALGVTFEAITQRLQQQTHPLPEHELQSLGNYIDRLNEVCEPLQEGIENLDRETMLTSSSALLHEIVQLMEGMKASGSELFKIRKSQIIAAASYLVLRLIYQAYRIDTGKVPAVFSIIAQERVSDDIYNSMRWYITRYLGVEDPVVSTTIQNLLIANNSL